MLKYLLVFNSVINYFWFFEFDEIYNYWICFDDNVDNINIYLG